MLVGLDKTARPHGWPQERFNGPEFMILTPCGHAAIAVNPSYAAG